MFFTHAFYHDAACRVVIKNFPPVLLQRTTFLSIGEFFRVPIPSLADPKFFRGLAIFFTFLGCRFEIIASARIPVRTGFAFA